MPQSWKCSRMIRHLKLLSSQRPLFWHAYLCFIEHTRSMNTTVYLSTSEWDLWDYNAKIWMVNAGLEN